MCHFNGRGLALLGGLADGVDEAHFRLRESPSNQVSEVPHLLHLLRRLGGDADARVFLEREHVFILEYDVEAIEIAGEAAHLHVIALPDNDDVIAGAREVRHGAVRDVDERACGFDDIQSHRPSSREVALGCAVGRHHQRRRLDLGDVLRDRDALRLEGLQDGGVMDEVTEDREWTGVGVLVRELDGVANAEAHAEVGRPEDPHNFVFQSILRYKLSQVRPGSDLDVRIGEHVAKSWNRIETWLALFALGVGLILLAVGGLWVYISATTKPIYPNAQDVSSVAGAMPARQWSDAAERARQIIRAAVAEQNLPGLSVAVGAGNEIVWAEGFGLANLESKTPVSPETRFRIGTASAVLTSAAAGLLLEQDKLKLDEKIQAYVPEFLGQQWPATLRQVMGHVAGVRSDGGDEGPLYGEQCDRPVDAIEHFDTSLRFEPGTEYRFSNFGFILVSAAIETAADKPFLSFIRAQIFEPLGMDHTEPDLATESSPDQASPYFPRFAADPRYGPDPMREINLSCYSGSSVFLSTPSDLVRFAMAMSSGKLLKPETVTLLHTAQRLSSGAETGYGLGWDLETVTFAGKPTQTIGHDGDVLGGMVSSLTTFPEHGIIVSVISNTSYADTAGLAVKIAEAFKHSP